jgi:hypothetical protein
MRALPRGLIVPLITLLLINYGCGLNQNQLLCGNTLVSIKDEGRYRGALASRWYVLPDGIDEPALMMNSWASEDIVNATINNKHKDELPISFPHVLNIGWSNTSPKIIIDAIWRSSVFSSGVSREEYVCSPWRFVSRGVAQFLHVGSWILMRCVPWYEPRHEQIDAQCGRVADIAYRKMEIQAALRAIFLRGQNIDHQRTWSCINFDPWALLALHAVELPLHNIELMPENHGGHYTDSYESASEQANVARPSRHHSLIYLVLGLSTTATAVFVAFKSAEYADDHGSRFWWLPFLGFLALAFWIAAHAIPIDLPG